MKWALILAAGLGSYPLAVLRADDPMPVTTDTPDYCLSLARRMEATGSMPPQIRVLWEEGRDMCLRGHIRGGLARLRRAMMISRGDAE